MATGAIAATAAIGLIGAGLSGIAHLKAGKAQEAAGRRNAEIKRLQANELIERAQFNIRQVKISGKAFQESQLAAFAKAGVQLDSASTIIALTDTMKQITEEIGTIKRQTDFQADMLRRGASIEEELGREARKASKFQAYGSFLGGAAGAAQLYSRSTTSSSARS